MLQRLIAWRLSCALVWLTLAPGWVAAQLPDLDIGQPLTRALLDRYRTDKAALERSHRIPLSQRQQHRFQQFYRAWQRALDGVDFDELEKSGQIDYLLLRNALRHQLRQLDLQQQKEQEVRPLVPFAGMIVKFSADRSAMRPLDAVVTAGKLDELTAQVRQLHDRLAAMQPAEPAAPFAVGSTVANRAANTVDRLRRSLARWHRFYDGYDPQFTWWTKQPYATADAAIEGYADLIRKRLVDARTGPDRLVGDPIGEAALEDELRLEMIPYAPEQLIEIANREFAWCDAEMEKAATAMGFDDWRKAQDHVKSLHVAPGEQPRLIHDLAREAVQFLDQRQLVTIPDLCREVWRIEMLSPERQKVNPYFLGGETIQVAFPTDGMAHRDKLMSLRGNNIHFARATVHHELIPGHHLQGFMAERFNSHRRQFATPFLVEGWALYWEMLLWDLDFARSPEDRIGMLFWRKHRCARIIFSLNFHLNRMSAGECVDFLVERVGHERNNATAEVRRSILGNYGPLYQAAYMLGGLQLRALRRELVASRQLTEREFHDRVLRENSIPVELIRAQLGGHPLTADYEANWNFYDVP